MKEIEQAASVIRSLVANWQPRLSAIEEKIQNDRVNRQNRTIRQILGHLIDSASNNLHRTVHLQYQPSPLQFPDYANLGANDTWIALQNYREEDWSLLVQLWQYSNLHLVHVLGAILPDKLDKVWISALGERITLRAMIVDYPRHLQLHLDEIEELFGQV